MPAGKRGPATGVEQSRRPSGVAHGVLPHASSPCWDGASAAFRGGGAGGRAGPQPQPLPLGVLQGNEHPSQGPGL